MEAPDKIEFPHTEKSFNKILLFSIKKFKKGKL